MRAVHNNVIEKPTSFTIFISVSTFECKLGKYPTCLHTDFVRYFAWFSKNS